MAGNKQPRPKTAVPKPSRLGAPPPVDQAPANIKEARKMKDLNFKVTPELHDQFRTIAFKERIPMAEILRRAFALYKEQQGYTDESFGE